MKKVFRLNKHAFLFVFHNMQNYIAHPGHRKPITTFYSHSHWFSVFILRVEYLNWLQVYSAVVLTLWLRGIILRIQNFFKKKSIIMMKTVFGIFLVLLQELTDDTRSLTLVIFLPNTKTWVWFQMWVWDHENELDNLFLHVILSFFAMVTKLRRPFENCLQSPCSAPENVGEDRMWRAWMGLEGCLSSMSTAAP